MKVFVKTDGFQEIFTLDCEKEYKYFKALSNKEFAFAETLEGLSEEEKKQWRSISAE